MGVDIALCVNMDQRTVQVTVDSCSRMPVDVDEVEIVGGQLMELLPGIYVAGELDVIVFFV